MTLDRGLTEATGPFPPRAFHQWDAIKTQRNDKTPLCFESGTLYLCVHRGLCTQSDIWEFYQQ